MQLGLDPDALVLGGLDAATVALLRDPAPRTQAAGRLRLRLASLGVPTDPSGDPDGDRPGGAVPDLLAPELATAAVLTGSRRAAQDRLTARAAAWVRVEGAGRVGAGAAALLAAAGVGRLQVEDPEPVGPADTTPAGARLRDTGRRRDVACEAALERHLDHHAPLADAHTDRAPRPGRPEQTAAHGPDVVVLAPVQGLARGAAQALVRERTPHLLARVEGAHAVVGPLVLPGQTCCLHCTDLHRAARDPAWPRLLAQAESRPVGDLACDVALAALAAAQVAVQVLALLDGAMPAAVSGTLETTLPDGLTRRRTWSPHPGCGCQWDAA